MLLVWACNIFSRFLFQNTVLHPGENMIKAAFGTIKTFYKCNICLVLKLQRFRHAYHFPSQAFSGPDVSTSLQMYSCRIPSRWKFSAHRTCLLRKPDSCDSRHFRCPLIVTCAEFFPLIFTVCATSHFVISKCKYQRHIIKNINPS